MIERLNRDCFCISLDRAKLAQALETELGQPGLYAMVQNRNPHLFSAQPVFVGLAHAQRMREVVLAVEHVAALPAFQRAVLARAPESASHDPGNPGVFLGFDFHLEAGKLGLIEINTNPGSALLSVGRAGARAARLLRGHAKHGAGRRGRGCVRGGNRRNVPARMAGRGATRQARTYRDRRPPRPRSNTSTPSSCSTSACSRAGIEAVIAEPGQLRCDGTLLSVDGQRIDLIYNRLTDFALDAPEHAAVRRAWEFDAAVVTPHPRAHALFADKPRAAV